MPSFYTTRPEDVAQAHVSGWPMTRYALYEEFTGLWHMQVEFKAGPDEVVFTGRGFRADSKKAAEEKAEAQYRRLIAKHGRDCTRQSGDAVARKKADEREDEKSA